MGAILQRAWKDLRGGKQDEQTKRKTRDSVETLELMVSPVSEGFEKAS